MQKTEKSVDFGCWTYKKKKKKRKGGGEDCVGIYRPCPSVLSVSLAVLSVMAEDYWRIFKFVCTTMFGDLYLDNGDD